MAPGRRHDPGLDDRRRNDAHRLRQLPGPGGRLRRLPLAALDELGPRVAGLLAEEIQAIENLARAGLEVEILLRPGHPAPVAAGGLSSSGRPGAPVLSPAACRAIG